MGYRCCAFGNRNSSLKLCADLREIVNDLIVNKKVDEFLTYGMGNFDKAFVSAVINARKIHKDIKLVLVVSGAMSCFKENQEYYKNIYDRIIMPHSNGISDGRDSLLSLSNYLIKNCDYIISGVFGNTGKAYSAICFAKKSGKVIIPVNSKAIG